MFGQNAWERLRSGCESLFLGFHTKWYFRGTPLRDLLTSWRVEGLGFSGHLGLTYSRGLNNC